MVDLKNKKFRTEDKRNDEFLLKKFLQIQYSIIFSSLSSVNYESTSNRNKSNSCTRFVEHFDENNSKSQNFFYTFSGIGVVGLIYVD